MKRCVRSLTLGCVGSLVLAAGASAHAYQVTKPLAGVPCSVTAAFSAPAGTSPMTYRGGVSCAGGIGDKTIDVVPQVFKAVKHHALWFNLSGAGLFQGPTPISTLRLSTSRAAVAGHRYRILVYAHVTLPNGQQAAATVCADCQGPAATLSTAGIDRYAPQAPTTVEVPGAPCFVTEVGPVFTVVNGTYVMTYGGQIGCLRGAGERGLEIGAQVGAPGPRAGGFNYFTIAGSPLFTITTTHAAPELTTARTVYLGHPYRVRVIGKVVYKHEIRTVTAYSKTYAP